MNLKYADELQELDSCPPKKAKEIGSQYGVRFVHEPIKQNDALPNAVISPGRFPDTDSRKCYSYGLSMYESKEKAIAAWKGLKLSNPNIGKIIGNFLMGGELAAC